MKALSVRQPWAWAIAECGKDIENRTWRTRYRGLLLIHAAVKGPDSIDAAHDPVEPLARANGTWPGRTYVTGGPFTRRHVVAVCQLVAVYPPSMQIRSPWAQPGLHHWQLDLVAALYEPVPTPGARGLWTPTPEVVDAVYAQMPPAAMEWIAW